jgi:AcrR family transcriptional regulator
MSAMTESVQPAPEPETLDGRRRRGQDNRARIVAAMMEIVHSGQVAPSAEQVAARADVGLRTVFRHFQDMDSLYREIAKIVGAEVRAIIARPLLGTTWRERVLDMAGRRTQAFEKISPYKRAADVFRHRSKFLGSDYLRLVAELREALRRELPAEIAGDADRFEALDMVMSYETWSRLRREQDLAADRAQAVVEAAVRRLIA